MLDAVVSQADVQYPLIEGSLVGFHRRRRSRTVLGEVVPGIRGEPKLRPPYHKSNRNSLQRVLHQEKPI